MSQLLNIKYLNRHKISYYVNIDGMVPKDNENKVIYLIKKHIISHIPYCLCGAYATNKILMDYGVNSENIINHPFTSLYKSDIDQKLQILKKKRISEKSWE